MSDITNDYEIRVFAMQRSGHHAIIEWILGHFDGATCFINDFSRMRDIRKQVAYTNTSPISAKMDMAGKFFRKECLLMNFEEENLKKVYSKLENHTHHPRGSSGKVINILVLRDPHNLFASRLRMAQNANSNRERWIGDRAVALWMQYAKEFIGEENNLPEGTICISYNDWFSDIEYRRGLSEKLCLEFTDKNKLDVPNYGGGSSFDKLSKKGAATEMKVLERWKAFRGNRRYERIFKSNPEMVSFSEKIFGKIKEET